MLDVKKGIRNASIIMIAAILLLVPIKAEAALGGGTCSGEPPEIPDSYSSSWWETGSTYTNGTEDYNYGTPTIWRSSGDVHDRYLNSGDFDTNQNYNYLQKYQRTDSKYREVTTYKALFSDDCSIMKVPAGSYYEELDTNTVNSSERVYTSRTAGISTTTISDGRYTSGVTTSKASATYSPGGTVTTTGSSYWVSNVEITVEAENIWIEEASPSCVQTYADGHTKGCTPTETIITNSVTHKRIKYYYQNPQSLKEDTKFQNVYKLAAVDIVENGDKYVDAFRGAPGPDFSCTKTYHNDAKRDCKSQVTINLNFNGWSVGEGTRVVRYNTTINEGNTHSDVEMQNFHYVIDVTYSGSRDAYVSTTATYYEDVNLALGEENYTVKCKKTFADGLIRDCIPESEVKYVNSKSQSSGGTHPVTGVFAHNNNQNGWALGGSFRNNYYRYDENNRTDNWTVRMLYVIKVQMANGTPENQFVAVNETHNKKVYLGNPTKASSPHLTDAYKPPTCDKTFATATTGVVEVRDCFGQMEWNHNWNNWTLGGSERILRFKYKENLKQDDWKIHFTYVSDVNIIISKPLTYQDESYGTYSCTKTYYHTYIGGGNTKDCLPRMYIDSDSGQNKNLGGQRLINYDYKNNSSSDLTLQTRPYGYKTIIGSVNATKGKTGYRDLYTCQIHWQNNVLKDITMRDKVWTSTVVSTGEEVNYIGETWANGYTDRKGDIHQPTARNEFYIVDPKTKDYEIHCTYPDITPFNNGLTPGWSYVTDVFAPVESNVPFRVVGMQKLEIWDTTSQAHEIDVDANGKRISGATSSVLANNYTGTTTVPHVGNKTFNDKTYQTGHWANFKATIYWDETFAPTDIVNTGQFREATWSYVSSDKLAQKVALGGTATDQMYRIDGDGYKIGGVNTNFPNSAIDHRLPNEDWNDIRFDYFSEENMRKPSGQVNKVISETYETVSLWAHSPLQLFIDGPMVTKFDVQNEYKSLLLWSDGAPHDNQGGTKKLGQNDNPWNQKQPVDVTNSQWSEWNSMEQGKLTPNPTVKVTFNEFESNSNYRTIQTWWGDEYEGSGTYTGSGATYPNGFKAWDFFFQELDVLVGEFDASGNPILLDPSHISCSDILPTFGCDIDALKDNGTGNKNYRLPTNVFVAEPRETEMEMLFNVTGVSNGSGQ